MKQYAGAKVKGHQKLIKQMNALGREGRKANRRALRKAGNLMRQAARAEAPHDDGTLAKAIIAVVAARKDFSNVRIGVDKSVVGPNGEEPWRYDHLVHDGFQHHSGKTVPGNPYMDRTYNNTIHKALGIYKQEAKAAMARIAKGGKA